jgi:hypothetical protein
MVKFLNFCCFIAHLPKKFKIAVARLFIVVLTGSFVLAAMASIEAAGQFEGFWKVKVAAWVICLLTVAFMFWRTHVKWHDGTFHADEYDNY